MLIKKHFSNNSAWKQTKSNQMYFLQQQNYQAKLQVSKLNASNKSNETSQVAILLSVVKDTEINPEVFTSSALYIEQKLS